MLMNVSADASLMFQEIMYCGMLFLSPVGLTWYYLDTVVQVSSLLRICLSTRSIVAFSFHTFERILHRLNIIRCMHGM